MAIASLAGAPPLVAARLGAGMLALQASIGALNDVADAPRDDLAKPGKPIPAGLVSARAAAVVVALGAAVGLVLSMPSGGPTSGVALLILAVGYVYDLWLKGTAWSWVPFAAGIPLLPVYAWIGATGSVPDSFRFLLPAAILGGAALAIANALADAGRDRAGGVPSVAVALGQTRAWRVHAVLHLAVGALAVAGLAYLTGGVGERLREAPIAAAGLAIGGLLIAGGVLLAASPDAGRRERGWELEAVGAALLAAAWLAAVHFGA